MPATLPSLVIFLLVFARISAALAAAPIFSEAALAVQVKIGLSAIIAAILTPAQIQLAKDPIALNWPVFAVLAGQQVLLGLAFALVFTAIFRAAESAGEIIGQQTGITMAAAPNTMESSEIHALAQITRIVAALIFLGLDGLQWVILSLGASLNAMPVTRVAFTPGLQSLLLPLATAALAYAVGLSFPLLATFLVSDLITGLLGRAMPSLNLFVLGLPLKVALGIGALIIAAPFLVEYITQTLRHLTALGLW
jgi:flagellar biosynthesis protein FliR